MILRSDAVEYKTFPDSLPDESDIPSAYLDMLTGCISTIGCSRCLGRLMGTTVPFPESAVTPQSDCICYCVDTVHKLMPLFLKQADDL